MRLVRAFLVAVLLNAAGLPWVVTQAAGWARMALRGVSLDGRHACSLCLTAQKGAQSQKSADARVSPARLDLILPAAVSCASPALPAWPVVRLAASPRPAHARLDPPPPWRAA